MTARAHAKLLLFGEHSAVYGSPAVGVGLPWTFTASYEPGGSDWSLPGAGPHEPLVRELLDRLQTQRREQGEPALPFGRLTLESQVPLSAGFGSSSALCAALCRLFFPHAELDQLDKLAWQAEALFHGSPSGIDTVLALRQGCWALDAATRPPRATSLPPPPQALVVGAVRRQGDTKSLMADLARRRAAGDPAATRLLARLGELAAKAVVSLRQEAGRDLPELVNQARTDLRALGLESPTQTLVLDAALNTGALAGKLSGAGGGGAFFLLFADAARAEASLTRLTAVRPANEWVLPPRLVEAAP